MSQESLPNLLETQKALKTEYNKRRAAYFAKSVKAENAPKYLDQGWYEFSSGKGKSRLRKTKGYDEILENRLWCIFYLMGFQAINKGRNFKIPFKRHKKAVEEKQIDVLAIDDDLVIIAECKACENLSKRSLQKDIEEFSNLKKPISESIRKNCFSEGTKPKFVWIFVTDNVIWSENDRIRAESAKIHVITQHELRYFSEIAQNLGPSAKHQFLAEFLKGQKIPSLKDVTVPAIRGKLGGKRFYSFVSCPKQLLKIAFVNHRTLNDPLGAPSYQRLVQSKRLKQIGNFINGGGFFPTNILINFSQKVRFDPINKDETNDIQFGHLYLPERYKSAWIIDGQHRLLGYTLLEDDKQQQNIFVIAFEQIPHDEEAHLFVTINHEQKTVPRNLLDDLQGELKWGSTVPGERIGAIAARALNLIRDDMSTPFFERIGRQGIKLTDENCLTVPQLKEGIVRSGLIGSSKLAGRKYVDGPLSGATDEDTLKNLIDFLNLFFGQVRDANEARWAKGRKGLMCVNIAIQGFLRFLSWSIGHAERESGSSFIGLSVAEILEAIKPYTDPVLGYLTEVSDQALEQSLQITYGSGGPKEYAFFLASLVNAKNSKFVPQGFEDWQQGQDKNRTNQVNIQLEEIETALKEFVFQRLSDEFGEESYIDATVSKEIHQAAYGRSLDDPLDQRAPLEYYLNLIEIKKVIDKNWKHLKSELNIPLEGEKGQAKNLKWLEKINALRRIKAHPGQERRYKPSDFEFVDWIHATLLERLEGKVDL